jgi:hypothetical protein
MHVLNHVTRNLRLLVRCLRDTEYSSGAFEHKLDTAVLRSCELDIRACIRRVESNACADSDRVWRHRKPAAETEVDRPSLQSALQVISHTLC